MNWVAHEFNSFPASRSRESTNTQHFKHFYAAADSPGRIETNWLEAGRSPSPQLSPPGEGGLAARRLQVQFPLLGERQGEGERASSFVLFLRLALMSR